MRTNSHLVLISVLISASVNAQPTDPAAPAAPLRYESAFTDYRAQQDAPLLPWQKLFTEDGAFADKAVLASQMASPASKVAMETPAKPAPVSSTSTASDTRGRIESINTSEGKVKLKHGPIPKFDMPGMTMVFRVQDPKLLTQIKVGDEVGVTLEKSGSGFVITGFQK